jgi:signal transduction histidine kinase/DNA-binding response OmpR family regulator
MADEAKRLRKPRIAPLNGAPAPHSPLVIVEDRRKVNILVVDDIPEKHLAMRVVLEELGENVVSATSGREALRKLLEQEFAVILLDVNMPEMDGFETAQLIRQRKANEHTPIIFITAFGDEMQSVRGYSLGAVDYILSPVVPEILRTKVSVFVDLFRKTEQVRQQAEHEVELARVEAARAAAEEARSRSAFLAEATNILVRSLDYDKTLETFARVLVPALGPWAVVSIPGESPRDWKTRIARLSEGGETRIATFDGFLGLGDASLARAIEDVAASAEPHELRFQIDGSERPAAVLPLVARGKTLGAIAIAAWGPDEPHSSEQRDLAEDLAARAAIVIDNARLYRDIQEADRRKNEFLAMLAHELRNPLAPIRTAVEILRLRGRDLGRLESARDVIERQVTQLARLVDDLLDVSRVTSGKIRLQIQPLEMAAVIAHALETARPLFEARRQKLTVDLPPAKLWVMADLARLSQVLANLLNNAAKYTEEGGRVSLSARSEDGEIVVRVRDTGIGIPKEALPIVWELFTQVDRSLDRSQGGLGIGLTVVRRIVELHGGRVEALSDGPGRGSEFVVRLPSYQTGRNELEGQDGGAMKTKLKTASTVLVVDDNVDAAEMIAELLALTGHDARVAHDGPSAIALAQEIEPDVVLLDIGLPGMNGYEVAKQLRAIPSIEKALLIAVTGYGQDSDRQRTHEAGFDHHLVKPVKPDHLLELIAAAKTMRSGGDARFVRPAGAAPS